MIRPCPNCKMGYDDAYRSTICPHPTFSANDGKNNFSHHPESYLAGPEVLCVDCKKPLAESGMHHNAPGTNWGAALHWFKPPALEVVGYRLETSPASPASPVPVFKELVGQPLPPLKEPDPVADRANALESIIQGVAAKHRPIDLQTIIDKHQRRWGSTNPIDTSFLWAVINDILLYLQQGQMQTVTTDHRLHYDEAEHHRAINELPKTDVPCDCDVEMFGEHLDTCPNWKLRRPHPYDKRQPQVFTDEAKHFQPEPRKLRWYIITGLLIAILSMAWEWGCNR